MKETITKLIAIAVIYIGACALNGLGASLPMDNNYYFLLTAPIEGLALYAAVKLIW